MIDPFSFIVVVVCSATALLITLKLIPVVSQWTLKADLWGYDLNKGHPKDGRERVKVPETMGIVPGITYLLCLIFFQLFFPDSKSLATWNAALASIGFTVLLGFVDDVLELRWRYKLILPAFASLPLVMAYNVTGGTTKVVFPSFMADIVGFSTLNIGLLHLVYIDLLSIFASNSINIYAGINGLEVGQSMIIALFIAAYNIICMFQGSNTEESAFISDAAQFSLYVVIPFIFVSAGLFVFNRYPSRVFIGDTYTYFAGMVLAVAGILGHFSKSLLVLFIPQLINFTLSLPQLVGIVPCPRHRLPRYDPADGKLHAVKNHLTLINFALRLTGPMEERTICHVLLGFQVACCSAGLAFMLWAKGL
ncbi:Glycosyl transferase, family 4 [Carpediemonas membranifera]|uniref:UDP-N-acetylglucosamine--dolichyl-phosphate N-acetylglucosaminephosphotransferase n=1 Tax=Carpediemonas membranifera TaxID=201153 RepID=A0A8J6B0J5_9EUKA|nr:Glycosyl transferase, family 4 [Carpediemonas membranifera]|eukprot:KAG9391669.1 Glycosyl transferase, family 4 [Carpediemonas membranifera]